MIEVKNDELLKLRVGKKIVGELTSKLPPVKKEIDANTKATLELAVAIKSLAEKRTPEGEQVDMTPMFGTIEKLQENQNKIVELLEKSTRPRRYEFMIERDSESMAKKILVRESRGMKSLK